MRRAATGLVTAVGVALIALSVTAAAGATAPASGAAATLGQCVQNSGRLLVVVLMDESGSLRLTDPHNERVAGLRAALSGLSRLAGTSFNGRQPTVQVLFSGFSAALNPAPAAGARHWESVTSDDLGPLIAQAGSYAPQNAGRDTDYATALIGVRRLLAERAAALTRSGGPEPCKALIWFTDGQYSIEDRTDPAAAALPKTLSYAPGVDLGQAGGGARAVAAGARYLCRAGGLMDALRDDGVVKFTFGLSVAMPPSASSFLNAVTTGRGGATTCGSALSAATGQYLEVSPSQLFFAFANLLQSKPAPVQVEPVCPLRPCRTGTKGFGTVLGLRGFLLQADTGDPGATIALRAPTGATTILRPGTSGSLTLAGTALTQTWVSSQEVEVQGQFASDSSAWVGHWSYAFVAGQARTTASGASSVELFSGLEPALVHVPILLRGDRTPLTIALVDRTGTVVSTGLLARSASVAASLSSPPGGVGRTLALTPAGVGQFSTATALPAGDEASAAELELTAKFASPPLTPILPVARSYVLGTGLPPAQGFPNVSPAQLQLPSIQGRGTTRATLQVVGNPVAAGCVAIGKPAVQTPGGPRTVTYAASPPADTPPRCLRVAAGQRRTIALTFYSHRSTTGTVHVTIPLALTSSITRGTRITQITATFDLSPSPNVGKRILIIIALTLLGLLLPLLVLWALNYLTGRLPAPQRLLVLHQEVSVRDGELQAADTDLRSRYREFGLLSSDGARRGRRLQIGKFAIRAVAARRPGDLFRGPAALARTDRRIMTGPAREDRRRPVGDEAEVPLAVAGTWLFRPEPPTGSPSENGEDGTVRGTLTVVIADGADVEDGSRLVRDASATIEAHDWRGDPEQPRWREQLADRLRGRLDRDAGPAASEPASRRPPPPLPGDDPNDY